MIEPAPEAPYVVNCDVELRHDPDLENLIRNLLDGDVVRFGVVVRDLTSGATVEINPKRSFYAASLYKVAVLYEVFRQVEDGTLSLSQIVMITGEYLEWDLGTLAGLGWGAGTEITIAQALEAVITISDNATALLLGDLIGWEQMTRTLRDLGLDDTDYTLDTLPTTARDQARLLAAIACADGVSPHSSQQMLDLLARQQIVDRLPAELPAGVVVAHKSGNWDNETHDAGIVYSPGGAYILVVMTEQGWSPEPIARLSRVVYDFLNPAGDSEFPSAR
jgi:beta-lactamase class A